MPDAALKAERAYNQMLLGVGLDGLGDQHREEIISRVKKKMDLNRRYYRAWVKRPNLSFEDFVGELTSEEHSTEYFRVPVGV